MAHTAWSARGKGDKAFWISATIAYPFIVVLPPVLGGGWLPGAVVAWTVLSVGIAALLGGFAALIFDDSPTVHRRAEPSDERMPWRSILKVTAIEIAIVCLLVVLFAMLGEGFGAFTDGTTYGLVIVLALMIAIISPLVMRFGIVSTADVATKIALGALGATADHVIWHLLQVRPKRSAAGGTGRFAGVPCGLRWRGRHSARL